MNKFVFLIFLVLAKNSIAQPIKLTCRIFDATIHDFLIEDNRYTLNFKRDDGTPVKPEEGEAIVNEVKIVLTHRDNKISDGDTTYTIDRVSGNVEYYNKFLIRMTEEERHGHKFGKCYKGSMPKIKTKF